MKLPADKHIEKYVKYRDQLSADQIQWIETAMAEHEELRLLADWFALFFEHEEPDPEVGGSSSRPNQIELVPMAGENRFKRRKLVLAARSLPSKKVDPKTVNTFVSEEHKTLMRVLYHDDKEVIWIHLLSDYLNEGELSLLHIPGRDLHLVVQPGGKMDIQIDQIDKKEVEKWSACKWLLPIYKASLGVHTTNKNGFAALMSAHEIQGTVEITQKADSVSLEIFTEQSDPPGLLLMHSGSGVSLWSLNNGATEIPADVFRNRTLTLFFFK